MGQHTLVLMNLFKMLNCNQFDKKEGKLRYLHFNNM